MFESLVGWLAGWLCLLSSMGSWLVGYAQLGSYVHWPSRGCWLLWPGRLVCVAGCHSCHGRLRWQVQICLMHSCPDWRLWRHAAAAGGIVLRLRRLLCVGGLDSGRLPALCCCCRRIIPPRSAGTMARCMASAQTGVCDFLAADAPTSCREARLGGSRERFQVLRGARHLSRPAAHRRVKIDVAICGAARSLRDLALHPDDDQSSAIGGLPMELNCSLQKSR